MQWLESSVQPKGPRFKLFSKFYFSCTNEMDENKLSKNNFLEEEPCSRVNKGLSCFSGNNYVPKGARFKLLQGAACS
jgi:hypothetical protein